MRYTERTGKLVHRPNGVGVFWYFGMYIYRKQLVFSGKLTKGINKGDKFIFIFDMDIFIAFHTEYMSFCNFPQNFHFFLIVT